MFRFRFLLVFSFLFGCAAPAVTPAPVPVVPTITVEPLDAPEPIGVPVTPSPDFRAAHPQVATALDTCTGEVLPWGSSHEVKPCGNFVGHPPESKLPPGWEMLAVPASIYVGNFGQLGGLVGIATSGGEVVAFVVAVAAEAALPAALAVAVVALPVLSLQAFANTPPPEQEPFLQNWIAGRYPPPPVEDLWLVTAAGAAALAAAGSVYGDDHLRWGERAAERARLAAAVATLTTLQEGDCWHRPGDERSSRAVAMVFKTAKGLVTFLYELGTGTPTFLEGNVPLDQLAWWEHDWRGAYATRWEACEEKHANFVFDMLTKALSYLGLR